MEKSGAFVLVAIIFLVLFIVVAAHRPIPETEKISSSIPSTWNAIEFITESGYGKTVYITDTYIKCPNTVTFKTQTIYLDRNYSVGYNTIYVRTNNTWIRLVNGLGSPVIYNCPVYKVKISLVGQIYLLFVNGSAYTPIQLISNGRAVTIPYTDSSGSTTTLILYS